MGRLNPEGRLSSASTTRPPRSPRPGALDEALCRETRLRLVHVIEDASVEGVSRTALRAARGDRRLGQAGGRGVEIAILFGDPAARLLTESRTAAMVCIGSAAFRSPPPRRLGATAATLAESASCPVAIIRGDHATRSLTGRIAVVIDGKPDGAALHQAMQEARLGNAPVLAIGVRHRRVNGIDLEQPEQRLRIWMQRYPDVAVQLVAARGGLTRFLADTDQTVQLVVVGRADGDPMQRFAGPIGEGLVETASWSMLVVPTQILRESPAVSSVVGSKAK